MSIKLPDKVIEVSHIDPSVDIKNVLSSKWTFVSMMFDIDKYQEDKDLTNSDVGETKCRKFEVYIDKLYSNFRRLTIPRIIVTDKSVKEKILNKEDVIRKSTLLNMSDNQISDNNYKIPNIVFIVINFEDLQAFKFLDIVRKNRIGNQIYKNNRNSAVYNICTASKAEAMLRSIDINPYSSAFFSWLDLGYYREGHDYITYSVEEMDSELNKIMFNQEWDESKYYVGLITWVNKSVYQNVEEFYRPGGRCTVTGGFNFGQKDVAKKIYSDFLTIFENQTNMGYGHADEQTLFYTCLKNLNIVEFFPSDYFCDIFNCTFPTMHIDCTFNFLIPNLLKDKQFKILNTICNKLLKSHEIKKCRLTNKQLETCSKIIQTKEENVSDKSLNNNEPIVKDSKKYKIIFIVISSPGKIYNDFKNILLKFMNSREDIKTFFIYGNVNKSEILESEYDLYYDVEECLIPGIYDKTALALKEIDSKYDYDFIMRANISSFFAIDRLINYISSLPIKRCLTGKTGIPTGIKGINSKRPFVSGTGILMSRDVAQCFYKNYSPDNEYRLEIPDDVAISFIIGDKCGVTPVCSKSRYDFDYLNPIRLQHDSQIPADFCHFRLKSGYDRNLDVHNMNYLFNFFHNKTKNIKINKYTIFGERNSGTNYLQSVINSNFKLKFTQDYGHKHWFIKDFEPRGVPNTTTDNECIKSLDDQDAENTLFIFTVRSPYSWLKSMHRTPYHAPDFKNIEFSDFIRKSWLSYEASCPDDHRPGCSSTPWLKNLIHSKPYFIEEADNICQLRNQKNKHFLAIRDKVKNFYIIRQNNLEEDLKSMKEIFGLDISSDRILFSNYRNPKDDMSMSEEDNKFIIKELDWNIEEMLGFNPILTQN